MFPGVSVPLIGVLGALPMPGIYLCSHPSRFPTLPASPDGQISAECLLDQGAVGGGINAFGAGCHARLLVRRAGPTTDARSAHGRSLPALQLRLALEVSKWRRAKSHTIRYRPGWQVDRFLVAALARSVGACRRASLVRQSRGTVECPMKIFRRLTKPLSDKIFRRLKLLSPSDEPQRGQRPRPVPCGQTSSRP